MKSILERRLNYLYTGESFAIIVFIPLSFLVNYTYPHLQLYSLLSFWISFFLLEFILIQGAYYWHSKWKCLITENKSITPIKTVKLLVKMRTINLVLIFFSMILFVIDVLVNYPSLPIKGLLISGFIFIFAVLEFINYFYLQLSYDNVSDIKYLIKTKKLKRSSLSKDFKRVG
ncbi:general stress protein [Peribacillus sp. SI8-4]|uniref:general stress protein n=1 Tax=Peribacillus sp. SI8-4 TaxID=3048009 RepID=UPI002556430F|nr:general stress protein [Peribacillus sp. SI8-4]